MYSSTCDNGSFKTVLLIDDSPIIQEMLMHICQLSSFTLHQQSSSNTVLDQFNESQYDMVISDWFFDVPGIHKILEIKKKITCQSFIVLTSKWMSLEHRKQLFMNNILYLKKPILMGRLLRYIHQELSL